MELLYTASHIANTKGFENFDLSYRSNDKRTYENAVPWRSV